MNASKQPTGPSAVQHCVDANAYQTGHVRYSSATEPPLHLVEDCRHHMNDELFLEQSGSATAALILQHVDRREFPDSK